MKWIKASERLPEIIDRKATPRHVRVQRQKHDKSGTWIQKQTAYYFPDRFKTVEWEDWDDYSQEDFPYTEEDIEKGCVWLRAGWYASVDCDKCEGYWSAPLNVIEWLDETPDLPPIEESAIREEAERLYPNDSRDMTDTMLAENSRAAHISCALSYIPQLKAKEARVRELEATIERLQGQLTRMADFMESEFRKK